MLSCLLSGQYNLLPDHVQQFSVKPFEKLRVPRTVTLVTELLLGLCNLAVILLGVKLFSNSIRFNFLIAGRRETKADILNHKVWLIDLWLLQVFVTVIN
jgi:hypothetical protein